MLRRTSLPALLLLLGASSLVAPRGAAQTPVAAATQPSDKPQGTTSSAEARAALDAAIQSADNIYFERAVLELDKALAADSGLGLARVLRAWLAPGMTEAQREQESARGIAATATAPMGETLTALAFRERSRGNAVGAQTLFKAASELAPEDARLAYWASAPAGPNARSAAAPKAFTEKYPDFAPAYNSLAYSLSDAGDSAGALKAVQEYVRLAPREPNPYDSYGELLQRMGRYDEAAAQYQRAAQIDSAFVEAYAGLAEVRLLAGKKSEAMAAWRQAAAHAADAEAKLGFMDQLAIGELYAGNVKGAVEQFTENARLAMQQGDKNAAALAHRRLAVVEGARGDRAAVDRHLGEAVALGGAEAQPQRAHTAVAKALAGDGAAAEQAAGAFAERAKRQGNPGAQANAHGIEALVAAKAGDVARARAAIERAGGNPNARLARVYLAEVLERSGDAAQARTLRDEAMAGGNITLADAVVRMRLPKK
jgi:tetratricopeptide (TPR) repeat protein